jgi:hypothetical protein
MQEVWIGRLGRILPAELLRPPFYPSGGPQDLCRGCRGFPSILRNKKSKNSSEKKTKFYYEGLRETLYTLYIRKTRVFETQVIVTYKVKATA